MSTSCFGLQFERFWSQSTLPDIDLDFEAAGLERLRAYLEETYGADRVAGVLTKGKAGFVSAAPTPRVR